MSFQKQRKSRIGPHKPTPIQKYSNVLRIFIEDNCAEYGWSIPLLGYIRSQEWSHLYAAVTALQAEHAADHHDFLVRSQLGALVLKYPWNYRDIGLDKSPRETAVDKFYNAERQCRRTNRRFSSLRWTRSTIYRKYIAKMQLIIEEILGPLTVDSKRYLLDMCAFGPGSNVGVGGKSTHIGKKFFSKVWTTTGPASPYFIGALLRNPHFYHSLCYKGTKGSRGSLPRVACYDSNVARDFIEVKLKYVSSNKVSFVPKTAKTDRCIAIEPLGNSFVQKGIDTYMRERLAARGCDLSDQSRNQLLARHGSITGTLCTIDLSSASDTISSAVVRTLLPSEWFCMLNACRSPSYTDPLTSEETRYEKFTSMGNGFCFPLESLIFLAAVRAVSSVDKPVDCTHGVYGDDIIVPRETFARVISLLKFLGFTPNTEKTFSDGPFRESCGADWYDGRDVRPVYLDYPLARDVSLRIFHNATYRSPAVSVLFTRVREYLRSLHTPDYAYFRPFREEPAYRIRTSEWCNGSKPFHIPLGKTLKGQFGWAEEWWDRANLDGAFDVPLDQFMVSRWARWNREEQRWSWKEHIFRPVTDAHFEGSEAQYWSLLLGSPGGALYRRREARHAIVVR